MSYEDRCKLLKGPSLSDRTTFLALVECYKMKTLILLRLDLREQTINTNSMSKKKEKEETLFKCLVDLALEH